MDELRRSGGRTTRIADSIIQMLFAGMTVKVKDHTGNTISTVRLLKIICKRLDLEHPNIEYKTSGTTIEIIGKKHRDKFFSVSGNKHYSPKLKVEKEMRWSKLSLSEKLEILEHNKKLSCFEVGGERFAITAFVISKQDNDTVRFITDSMHVNNPSTFEDNGFFSNHEPSKTCRYKNYKMILQ